MTGMDTTNGSETLLLKNRLHESRSPYVRGHMKNPVAWQLWDPETLQLAQQHNRMLFVSIGYAACHWCHVMERESFESSEVADLLNDYFIPIKIDREERPDIDAIYMNYVQATTGSGGWPLNVFITPDLEPVFGGTYWPGPNNSVATVGTAMADTVGFLDILKKMKTVWLEQEQRCRDSAKEITRQLREFAQEGVHSRGGQLGEKNESDSLEIELLEEAYNHFERRYDRQNGGFASAPKFPTPVNLSFLLRLGQWPDTVQDIVGKEECKNATNMAVNTLRKMARGGIRDQIGYGFARYSVTKDWSLPHFEKMLYDQAQLLDVYLDAFLITRDPEMLGAVCDIVNYLTSPPMVASQGCFFSSEDADSYPSKNDNEKREGAYYAWTFKEIHSVLGPRDGDVFSRFYGASPDGNVAPHNDPHDEFINQNVLRIATTPSQLAKDLSLPESTVTTILRSSRQKMRHYRDATRPRPSLDDKIVVCWNGLAVSALSRTASALQAIDPSISSTCLKAATTAISFIRQELYDQDSKTLYRVHSSGVRGSTQGLCEDYAFLIQGLIDLYEATFDDTHLSFAEELQRVQLDRFRDSHISIDSAGSTNIDIEHPKTTEGASAVTGGFYTTPSPHPKDLLLRLKSGMDSAEPSANNISARNLYRLGTMLEDDEYLTAGRETVDAFEAEVQQFPFCFAGTLGSIVLGRLGVKGFVVIGDEESDTKTSRFDDRNDAANTSATEVHTSSTFNPMANIPAQKEDPTPPSHTPFSISHTLPPTSAPFSSSNTTATKTSPQDGTSSASTEVSQIFRTIRSRVAPDRTVVYVGSGKGQWLRQRNRSLQHVRLFSGVDEQSKPVGVEESEQSKSTKDPVTTVTASTSTTEAPLDQTTKPPAAVAGESKDSGRPKGRIMLCEGKTCRIGGTELL